MEEQEKILDFVEDKVFKDGITKTTMGDLATEMKISKKTIYKFFPSKDELVKAIAKRFMNRVRKNIEATLNKDTNAVEKFTDLVLTITNVVSRVGDSWMKEMQKDFPKLWQEIDNFRTKMIYDNLAKVVEQGKSEGLLEDHPTSIILTIYTASVRAVIQPDFVINNNFSLKQAVQHTFRIMMNGILTEKGKELFNQTIIKKQFSWLMDLSLSNKSL
jgi:AcrR family transcriptional regulator